MRGLKINPDSSQTTVADNASLLQHERKALEDVAAGVPLPQVLDELIHLLEEAVPGMHASVSFATPDAQLLAQGATAYLPVPCCNAIHSLSRSADTAAQGAAASAGQTVRIGDLATDPRWAEFRAAVQPHGLRACWLTPICGANGEHLGTFANYFSEVKEPTAGQLEIIDFVIHTAALAIDLWQTDRALKNSEDHHRHAVNLNPQVAWTSRSDGALDYMGKRWQEWTGTTGLGASWGVEVHRDDRQASNGAWDHACATGEPYDIEHRIRLRDGHYRWMRSRAFPRRNAAGAIVKWYGATEDIDERKQVEHELHEREAELRALNASLESQVLARTGELTELTRHLQVAQEEERSRLARKLHDELGALFTAVKFDVARLKARMGPLAPEIADRFNHFIELLDQGIDLKRQIIEDLHPSALNTLGLVQALEILVYDFARAYPIRVHCEFENLKLTAPAQLTIYRLVQEALANISAYAKAGHVEIVLKRGGDADMLVSISDDGVGFDPSFERASMYGLMGMHYRVESEGGALYVKSSIDHGTCISATLPLASEDRL